jgi:YfiH family protein
MRLPNWYRVERNGVRFYQAWNLQKSGLVKHGFSTRTGGVSPEPYESLNLGLGTDDDPLNVIANRRAFASALGIDPTRIVVPKQSHGGRVARVSAADAGRGAREYDDGIPETDALVTNESGVTLALHFADCVCVFLLDPVKRAIGVAHAGWRGTAEKIVQATVEAMSGEFGSDPGTLLAAVGPAINRHCYEVGPDVASELSRVFPHDERVMTQASTAKWWLDLKTANRLLLLEAGLKQENIAVSDQCTSCDRDEFFSHRRDGPTGRMGGWMALA